MSNSLREALVKQLSAELSADDSNLKVSSVDREFSPNLIKLRKLNNILASSTTIQQMEDRDELTAVEGSCLRKNINDLVSSLTGSSI